MPGNCLLEYERIVYDEKMPVCYIARLEIEPVVERDDFGAGVDIRKAGVRRLVEERPDQADNPDELQSDRGYSVQCFAGVESFDG